METTAAVTKPDTKARLCSFIMKLAIPVLVLALVLYAFPVVLSFLLGILFTLCAELCGLYWFMTTDSDYGVRISHFSYGQATPTKDKGSFLSLAPSAMAGATTSSRGGPVPVMREVSESNVPSKLVLPRDEGISPRELQPLHR